MIVWDLGEEMMYDMSSYVVVDVVDQPVIAVKSREPASQITPFLFYQEQENKS